jgi:hypothetical protein
MTFCAERRKTADARIRFVNLQPVVGEMTCPWYIAVTFRTEFGEV